LNTLSDPYRVLDISPSAGQDEIRGAYLKLLRSHPPEKDPEKFKEIRAAYDKLKDEKTRIRTAVLHMDLTGPLPRPLFPEAAQKPAVFRPDDWRDILVAAGELARRDFPEDMTGLDEEGMINEN